MLMFCRLKFGDDSVGWRSRRVGLRCRAGVPDGSLSNEKLASRNMLEDERMQIDVGDEGEDNVVDIGLGVS